MTNTPLENAIIQLLFETKAGRDAPLIPTSPGAENKTTAETTEFEKLYRHPSGTAIHTTAIRLRKATKAYYRDLEKLFKDGKRAENRVKAVRLVEAWLRNDVAPHLREATAAALGVTSQGVQGIAPQLTVNSAPRATPVVVVPPPPVPVIRATRAAVKPPVVEVDDSEDEDMDEDNVARRNSIKQGKKRAVSELHDENNYSIDTYYRGSMLEKVYSD
ncbi:putative transporter [Pseudohyphozyma bogoriensis]|nr:putative transporter [Pseudohyphozyma bogoriensis]